MNLAGVLMILAVLCTYLLASVAFDRGSREFVAARVLSRVEGEPVVVELLEELIKVGIRCDDVSMYQAIARKRLGTAQLMPFLVVIVGLWVIWSGWDTVVAAFVLALPLGLSGSFDRISWPGRPRRYARRTVPELLAGGFTVLARYLLVVLSLHSFMEGASTVNEGDIAEGVFLALVGVGPLAMAHRPTRWFQQRRPTRLAGDRWRGLGEKTVLFLRAFDDDDVTIRAPFGGIGPERPAFPGGWVRIEEYVATLAVGEGDFVAIGRPGEGLPELGAARTYWADDEWQSAVSEIAHRCRAIVMIAGSSAGVSWEIQELQRLGVLHKTIVFYPPDTETGSRERHLRLRQSLGLPRLNWDSSPHHLMPAAVFDKAGNHHYLLSEGRDWAAYAGALTFFLSAYVRRTELDTLGRKVRERAHDGGHEDLFPPTE